MIKGCSICRYGGLERLTAISAVWRRSLIAIFFAYTHSTKPHVHPFKNIKFLFKRMPRLSAPRAFAYPLFGFFNGLTRV